jgi:hypothetical protein
MKTLFEHIEYVQGKPRHVRERIAFGAAAGGTALIALVWFAGTLASGTLAIHASSFAAAAGQGQIVATGNANQNNSTGVAAVAAASGGSAGNASAPAHIEIINAPSATSSAAQTDRTTIPF